MKGWEEDKKVADRYSPEIKSIIGQLLIHDASPIEDRHHNTDYTTVFTVDRVRIACRIRSDSYLAFSDEFTIRSGRPSGNKTELRKILDGWGDYMFYGFGDGTRLVKWVMLDLDVFRAYYTWMEVDGDWPFGEAHENYDGSSRFVAFKIDAFPPDFVVGSSDAVAV